MVKEGFAFTVKASGEFGKDLEKSVISLVGRLRLRRRTAASASAAVWFRKAGIDTDELRADAAECAECLLDGDFLGSCVIHALRAETDSLCGETYEIDAVVILLIRDRDKDRHGFLSETETSDISQLACAVCLGNVVSCRFQHSHRNGFIAFSHRTRIDLRVVCLACRCKISGMHEELVTLIALQLTYSRLD